MFTASRVHVVLFIAALLAIGLITLPAVAQTGPARSGESSVVRKGEKVDISADTMEVLEKENRVVFTGNVKAAKGNTTLYADKVVVLTEKVNRPDGSKTDKVRKLLASGRVRIVKPDMTITGAKAALDVKKDIATVEGNVVVKKEKATIRGQKLIANLKTNITRVVAGGRQRVRGIFQR